MTLFSTLLFFFLLLNSASAENIITTQIGFFSSHNLKNWNKKTFAGATDYQIIQMDTINVLKAESHSSASGLFKQQKIDLEKTPYLNWRWRIDNRLENLNEQTQSGDDYSARIYIVIDGGWAFWKTKAINYVWASNTAKGTIWANAFAGKNAMMIAVRSNNDKTKTWYQEKRNVLHDLKQLLGTNISYIDAIALMTDTDNSKGNAIAYYGDIYFSSH